MIIWKKIGEFTAYDNFGIRNELFIWNIVSSVTIIIVVSIAIVLNIIGNGDLHWITGCTASIYPIVAMYLSVPYVIKMNERNKKSIGTQATLNDIVNIKPGGQGNSVDLPVLDSNHSTSVEDTSPTPRLSALSTISIKKSMNSTSVSGTKSISPNLNVVGASNYKHRLSVSSFKETTVIAHMTHWSQIVTTHYGFELFINHLESEWSVENLLFITEVLFLYSIFFFLQLYFFVS